MADKKPSGGGGEGGNGIPMAVLGIVAALAFFVPSVGEFVFQWVPAAVSVLTGVDIPGDVRMLPEQQPETIVQIDMHPYRNEALLAQIVSPFDAAAEGNSALSSPIARTTAAWWTAYVPISIFISLLLIVGILYAKIRLRRVRDIEEAEWHAVDHPVAAQDPDKAQLRWQKVVEHANTENPNDWRQAIIEADIMLDELLTAQGYHGDTLGDKMKQVERSDFNTIDLAWEAHKVRNRIAHEGFDHDLNDREVRRVIALYEQVLREFHSI
ncbi:MAG: hypothetical protein HYT30_02110 [Parcubacteria group bacterium]|nr:hypothetical protein [Parcubacteria group bacterium]